MPIDFGVVLTEFDKKFLCPWCSLFWERGWFRLLTARTLNLEFENCLLLPAPVLNVAGENGDIYELSMQTATSNPFT
jgi:hypothetical protein